MSGCAKSAPGRTDGGKETATSPAPGVSAPAASDFLGPMKRIEAGEVDYAYHTFGEGPPLVMIMGFTGTMSIWDTNLLRGLAATHQVTIFDNRGIGFSTDSSAAPLTMRSMADSTVELIDALGLSRPDILGWSMGGEIALTIAVKHGDKVGKVVAVSADAGSPHTVYVSGDVDKKLSEPNLPFEELMALLFPADQKNAEMRYLKSLDGIEQPPPSPEGVARQAAAEDAYATDTYTWDGLPSIKNPVLLITGDEDEVVPGRNSVIMAGKIPNAWLAQFPDAGHGVLFQEPERAEVVIDAFLGGS